VVYNWTFEQGSPQFSAPFVATRKDLVVSGASGVVGAIAGTTYDLVLATNLLVRGARACFTWGGRGVCSRGGGGRRGTCAADRGRLPESERTPSPP
jgi:hypothetical protein